MSRIAALILACVILSSGVGWTGGLISPAVLNPGPSTALAAPLANIKSSELNISPSDILTGETSGLELESGALTVTDDGQGTVISEPLMADQLFSEVGPHWDADIPDGAGIEVQLRVGPDGETWGNWHVVETESPLGSTRPNEHYGELVADAVAGPLNRYVQYRLDLAANPDDPSAKPVLRQLTLTFIDATEGPTPIAPSSKGILSVDGVVNKPGVVSRSAWGCPDGQSSPGWPYEHHGVTHLVIHNTDSSNSITNWPAHVRAIWYYHAVTLGWGDVGYNYLIDPNGVIYEGRAGGDDVDAGHVYGFNAYTMGVGCMGTYTTQPISGAMQSALENLLAWKASQKGLDPQGSRGIVGYSGCDPLWINHPVISGHRDFPGHNGWYPYHCNNYGGTACPGDALAGRIPTIRNNVANLINGSGGQDTTPPNATISSLPTYSTGPFTVSWSASDPSGIKWYDVEYRVNNGGWVSWLPKTSKTSEPWGALGNGDTYRFRVRATDNAGNVGPWTAEVSTTVDTRPPDCGICDITSPATHTWFVIEVWGYDSGSGVASYDLDYRVDGGAWQCFIRNGQGPYFLFTNGVAGRTHEFRVRARDNAGNLGAYSDDGSGWSRDKMLATAGHDSSGLHRIWLPIVSKNGQ